MNKKDMSYDMKSAAKLGHHEGAIMVIDIALRHSKTKTKEELIKDIENILSNLKESIQEY